MDSQCGLRIVVRTEGGGPPCKDRLQAGASQGALRTFSASLSACDEKMLTDEPEGGALATAVAAALCTKVRPAAAAAAATGAAAAAAAAAGCSAALVAVITTACKMHRPPHSLDYQGPSLDHRGCIATAESDGTLHTSVPAAATAAAAFAAAAFAAATAFAGTAF